MKYYPIKNTAITTYCADSLREGINEFGKSTGNGLRTAVNFINGNGRLERRPAVRCDAAVPRYAGAGGVIPFKITGTEYYLDGKKYNIACYSERTGLDFNGISVYLISDNDDIRPIGYIYKTFSSDPVPYQPLSVTFMVGNKTKGMGIYGFVHATNNKGNRFYDVFEARGFGNTSWAEIADEERYVPTVLINGRGNYYNKAQETLNLNLDEPATREKRNMICSHFKSYFTSDGYSWSFFLPEKTLDEKTVNCRVYFAPDIYYDFEIPPGGSDTKVHNGRNYTAYCNLREGRLYFMSDGAAAAIPRVDLCPQNNIVVTAAKTVSDDISGVISCQNAVFFNSRAFFYKSYWKPDYIYSCKLSNPLYFPENSKVCVGSSTRPITAAGYQNDKLIVFCAGETYKVSTAVKENTVRFDTPAYNTDISADTLSCETISTKVGCGYTDTVASCAGQLIWLGSDKKVYTLEATTYGSEKNVFCISERINGMLKSEITGDFVFAAVKDGIYYLFCNSNVYVCDCHLTNMGYAVRYGARNLSNVTWFKWELPGSYFTSCKNCGELMVSAYIPSGSNVYLYHFIKNGKDRFADIKDGETVYTETPVETRLETNDIDFGTPGYKTVKEAVIEMTGGPADIEIKTDNGRVARHIHNIKSGARISLPPDKAKTKRINVSVSSKGGFDFNGLYFTVKR